LFLIFRVKKFLVGDNITFRASLDSNSGPLSTPPSFVQKLQDKQVTLNSQVFFEIQAGGEPQPSVTWFLNDFKLNGGKNINMSKQRTVHIVTFQQINEKDLGTLKCVLTNFAGKDECSCTISKASAKAEDLNNNTNIPTLVAKSNTLQVIRENDAEFVVEFGGNPEPEFCWFKDQIRMTEDYGAVIMKKDGKCSMVLKEVTPDDEGKYSCVAKNMYGEATCVFTLQVLTINESNQPRPQSILITEEGPPVILEKFIDKQSYEGDTARFQVKAKGVPKPTISWFFNDVPITTSKGNFKLSQDGSNYILTILVCEKDFSGHYKCVAENPLGKVIAEDDIVIHESIYPPKFLQQSKNITLNANETCTITSIVKGKPKPSVEWYKDNRCLDERSGFQFINSDDSHSLVIQRFTEKHSGVYKCSAFNDAGESSCKTEVTLLREKCPPQFLEPASDTTVSTGETSRLEVTLRAHPSPKITWFKDGELLNESKKYSFEQLHESTYVLFMKNAEYEDSGTYKCIAENSLGKEISECILTVAQALEAPRFTKGLADFTALEHDKEVELQVIVAGNPKPDVLFYKDGTILESSARRKLVRENQQHTLRWKYVLPDDSGEYSVVASNSEGEEVSSCKMTVATESKSPEIKPHDNTVFVNEGDAISLTIEANGVPTPEISWNKGKTAVEKSENVNILNNFGKSTLTINAASLKDAGDYQVVAKSSSGTANTVIRVEIEESKKQFPPEFSSTLNDVEVCLGQDASLEIGIAGHPEPKVQWKKDGKTVIESKDIKKSYQNGVLSLNLTNCRKETAGCYECVASNELGEVVCQCLLTVQKGSSGKEVKRTPSEKSKAPKFLQTLHDLRIHLSEPIVLETVVGGTPFPDVRWYKQDKLLHPNKRMKIGSNSKDGKSYLRIVNAGKEDAGEYEIVAKNKHGETSMSCEVFVKDLIKVSRENSKKETTKPVKPSIVDKPEEPHVNEGDEIKFSFTVHGNPQPTVEILKGGNTFKPPSHIVTQFTDNVFTFFTNDSRTSDEAVYEFTATNQHGNDSFKLEILVDEIGELEVVAKTIGSDSRKQSKQEESLRNSHISSSEEDLLVPHARISPKPPSKRGKKPKKLIARDSHSGGEESDTDGIISEDVIQSIDEQIVEASSVPTFESAPIGFEEVEPSFIEEPQNQKIMEGRPLKLAAKVSGTPEPTVKWFKDGKQLDEGAGLTMECIKGQATLKINKCKEGDSGEYVCWLENKLNKVMVPVMVEVILLPMRPDFTTKMQDNVITEGQDATFEIGISGLPYPDIQWFQDNRLLSQSDRIIIHSDKESKCHKLTIKNCTLREGRNLKCIARNTQGTTSLMASLKVQEAVLAPQFTTPLQDCEVMQTEDLKLKVGFTGKPKPLVEWSINDQAVKSSPKIKIRSERESSQLTIANCKDEHTGKYKAICSNTAGEVSTECQVTVTEELRKPEFTSTPKGVKCVEGKTATFKINISGKPQPDIKWSFNGNEVMSKEGVEVKKEATKTSLVIRNCSLSDSGVYTCEITNKAGTTTCNVELTVEEGQSKPTLLEKFKETMIKEKENLELSVTFKGKPKPTVIWSKNEIKLKQDSRFSLTEEPGKATLRLTGCTTSDTGNYKVTLKNTQGDTHCKAKIQVEEEMNKPAFSAGILQETKTATEGESLVLSVKANGIPKPKFTWTKGGQTLSLKSGIKISSTGEELKIEKCKPSDAGFYECTATNKAGSEKTACQVKIDPEPKAPVFSHTPERSEISLFENDSVVENFSVISHPVPSFEVTKDGKTVTKTVTVDYNESTGEGIIEITNVSYKDAGKYKVIAKNDKGASEFDMNVVVKDPDGLLFSQELTDLTTMEDGNAILEVMFKGHVVDVDWYKDNEYIDESDKYEIIDEEDRCTCVVHNCTVADAGTYRCEILNEKNSESCSAVVTVKEGVAMPAFLEKLKDKSTAEEGEKFVMEVISEGKPVPAVKWLKNGTQVLNGANIRIKTEGRVHSLTISNVSQSDAGSYLCRLSNSVGVVECKSKVDVTKVASVPVKITQALEDITYNESKDITLQVQAEGFPAPDFEWFKNGDKVTNEIIVKQDESVCVVTIPSCTKSDAGLFKCVVSNKDSSVSTECNVAISPQEKAPEFTAVLKDLTSYFDDTLCLELSINAYPVPSVKWFKDGKCIDDNTDYVFENDLESGSVKLLAKSSDQKHSGIYKALIANELGEISTECQVSVVKKPAKPTFSVVLEDQELDQHSALVLKAVAVGNPEPQIQWLKDDVVLDSYEVLTNDDGNIETKLEIHDALPEHSGKYTCIAKNDAGKSQQTSQVSVKEILNLPKFEYVLKDYTGFEGDEIILSTECSGTLPQSQKWSRNGKAIHNTSSTRVLRADNMDHKFMLKIPKAKISDTGTYELEVTNSAGSCVTTCKVDVQEAPVLPQFLLKLKDQNNLTEGRSFECTTKASGKPVPQLSWFLNDVELLNGDNINITSNEGKSSLIMKNLNVEQNGILRCDAVNIAGTISSQCKLKIAEAMWTPEITKTISDITVEEGEEFVLKACVNGNPLPEVAWSKSRKPIAQSENIQMLTEGDEYQLVVRKARVEDGGRYKITATNQSGERFATTSVTVNQKVETPSFIKPLPEKHYVPDGQMLALEVEYVGSPKPRIKWKYNGRNLKFDKRFQIVEVSDNVSRLEMLDFSKGETGVYICSISNDSGEVSCECNVGVPDAGQSPPVFTEPLGDLTLQEGENIVLEVTATGVPEPEISFYKDDMVLQNVDGIYIENQGNKWTVTIDDVEANDSGRYLCKALNALGTSVCACQVDVIIRENREDKVTLKPLKENTTVSCERGKSVTFEAHVSGENPPLVEWASGENLIDPSEKYEIIDGDDGYNALIIHDVVSGDEGEYACIADLKEEDDEVEIVFTLKLARDDQGEEMIRPTQQSEAESKPQSLQNIVIDEEPSLGPGAAGEEDVIAVVAQPQFESVPDDLTSKFGPVVKKKPVPPPVVAKKPKKSIKELPMEAPRFSMKPKDKDASAGSEVHFTCNVSGSPVTQLQWFFNGVALGHSAKYVINMTGGLSNLVITDVSPKDIGEYKVIAKNEQGESEVQFFLSVDGQRNREELITVEEEQPLQTPSQSIDDGLAKGPVNVSM